MKENKMKIVQVYLKVNCGVVIVDDFSETNIKCKTYDDVVAAFGTFAKKVGYKSIEDVPKDAWSWQNSSSMDYTKDWTQDKNILNLVKRLMNGGVGNDPRNVIWEG